MSKSLTWAHLHRLKPEIGVIIVTAVDVEGEAVERRLEPLVPDRNNIIQETAVGYFGNFLAAHIHMGEAGGVPVASDVTSILTRLREPNDPTPVVVLMPGILCGLRRHRDDHTTGPRTELAAHQAEFLRDRSASGDRIRHAISATLKADSSDFLEVPRYLTPELPEERDGQFIGTLLLASHVVEYDRVSHRPGEETARESPIAAAPLSRKIRRAFELYKQALGAAGDGKRLQTGLIASGDGLIRSYRRREDIRIGISTHRAIGVEMEGHGLAASVSRFHQRTDRNTAYFLFLKAVSDWGVMKSDAGRQSAAEESVGFLHYCLREDGNIFDQLVRPASREHIASVVAEVDAELAAENSSSAVPDLTTETADFGPGQEGGPIGLRRDERGILGFHPPPPIFPPPSRL
jgi:hypothetical protein